MNKPSDKPQDKIAKGQRWFHFVVDIVGVATLGGSITLLFRLYDWLSVFDGGPFAQVGLVAIAILLPLALAGATMKALVYWYDEEAKSAGLPPMQTVEPKCKSISPLLYAGGGVLFMWLCAVLFSYLRSYISGAPP